MDEQVARMRLEESKEKIEEMNVIYHDTSSTIFYCEKKEQELVEQLNSVREEKRINRMKLDNLSNVTLEKLKTHMSSEIRNHFINANKDNPEVSELQKSNSIIIENENSNQTISAEQLLTEFEKFIDHTDRMLKEQNVPNNLKSEKNRKLNPKIEELKRRVSSCGFIFHRYFIEGDDKK